MKFLNAKYKAKKMVINFNHLLKEHIENELDKKEMKTSVSIETLPENDENEEESMPELPQEDTIEKLDENA